MIDVRVQLELDIELLETVLVRDDLQDSERNAFERMLRDIVRGPLSTEQRAWATAALEGRRYEPPEKYENLISSGRAPRGREVELMVRDKPLRPPGRK